MFHKITMPLESPGSDGVMVLTFPDNGAGPGYAGFVRHMLQLSQLDPGAIVDLLDTPEGAALFGDAEVVGGPKGLALLKLFDRSRTDKAEPLTDEQYERMLRGVPLDDEEPRG